MTQNADFGGNRTVSGLAKVIMILQMLVIALLSSWIVEEYLNNIYLQAYVNGVVQADAAFIAIVVIVSVLAVAVGLLKALKSDHKGLRTLVNQPQVPSVARAEASARSTFSPASLHPMVAALKADIESHHSMEPLPRVEVNRAPAFLPAQVQRVTPLPKTMTGTPSTVITGTMPVLKRVNPDQDRGQNTQD